MQVSRAFIDGEYGQVHYRTAGRRSHKPTIVCLHMVPKSSRSFAKLMPLLAKDRLVIAPDYPGYGDSQAPPSQPHITIQDYGRVIRQMLCDLKCGPVCIVGYHTGSMVAVEIADSWSEEVLQLVNISAPIFTDEETAALHDYFSPVPLDIKGQRFITMWSRILEHRGPGMTLEMAAQSMCDNMMGGENYEWGHRAAFNYTGIYAQKLTGLNQPILVLNIQDDLYNHTLRVDKLLKNGIRKNNLNWGHGFLEICADQAAKETLDFFDQ